jgi:hypothetical protein
VHNRERMKPTRNLLLFSLILVAGCASSAAKPTVPVAPAQAAQPKSLLELVPSSSAAVMHVDVPRLLASRVWQRYGPKLLATPKIKKFLDMLAGGCDLDLTRDLQTIDFSVPADLDPMHVVMVARGRIDSPKLERCFQLMTAYFGEAALKVTHEGQVTSMTNGVNENLRVAWPAPDTMVMSVASMNGTDDLSWLKSDTAAAKATALVGPSAQLRPDQLANCVFVMTGKLAASMAAMQSPPLSFWANITQDGGLEAEIGLRYDHDGDARRLADGIGPQLDAFRKSPFATRFGLALEVQARASDLIVNVHVDAAHLDALIDFVEPYVLAAMK